MNRFLLVSCLFAFVCLFTRCNDNAYHYDNTNTVPDSSALPGDLDTSMVIDDGTKTVDSISEGHAEPLAAKKGSALVYCPTKMIVKVPSFISASISKNEMEAAYADFVNRLQVQNPGVAADAIAREIKTDSIDIFARMMVSIDFDTDDFKLVSGDAGEVKTFTTNNTLQWDCIVKPLQSTRRSIVTVKFYGVDSGDNKTLVHQKTLDITVTVDARSYIDKWKDFLLEDSKTTITAIVIPFVTFLGGFLTAKRKKKDV